jgi:nicotinate-nucleotide adenylyltransferase
MKIGLFGGTFNPFHLGHLKISRYVKTQYRLDRVYFIPSATPPHKPGSNLADARDRFTMVENSIAGEPGFEVSDMELRREGPSFTIDTVTGFKKQFLENSRIYLMMGSDAFFDILTWKDNAQLFSLVPIIVMCRGENVTTASIAAFVDEKLSKGYSLTAEDGALIHSTREPIYLCRVPKIDISSTMVRDNIKHNRSVKGLVPPAVEAVIKQKDLYT